MNHVSQSRPNFYAMSPDQQNEHLLNMSGLLSGCGVEQAVEPVQEPVVAERVEVRVQEPVRLPAPQVRMIPVDALAKRMAANKPVPVKVPAKQTCKGCNKPFVPVRPGLERCPPCYKGGLAKQKAEQIAQQEAYLRRRQDQLALEQGVKGWSIPAETNVQQLGDLLIFTLRESMLTLNEREYRKDVKDRLRRLVRAAWDLGGEQAVVECFGDDTVVREGPMVTILIGGESITVPPKVKVDAKAQKKRNHEANLAKRREESRNLHHGTGKKK